MTRPVWLPRVLAVVALGSIVVACGSSSTPSSVGATSTSAASATSAATSGVDAAAVLTFTSDAGATGVADWLMIRLDAEAIDDVVITTIGDHVEVALFDASLVATVEELLSDATIQFRPVLAMQAPDTAGAPASGDAVPAATGVVTLTDAEGGMSYHLGPAFLLGTGVQSAVAGPAGTGVVLTLQPGAAGLDPFNRAAKECFDGAPTCPGIGGSGHGLIAIVVSGRVLTAPEIATGQAEFSPFADSITIAGNYSASEGQRLAAVLAAGPAPKGLRETSGVLSTAPTTAP